VSIQESNRKVCRARHPRWLYLCLAGGVLLSFSPARLHASIVINEVMASNVSSFPDPQGDFDDWIELYNAGDTSISLAGMYLTDDLEAPTKWRIPAENRAAATIPAHGYLLIWMDGETSDNQIDTAPRARVTGPPASGFHAGFRLGADGDEVYLFHTDGTTLIDSLVFEEQTPDISYGRYPDGGDMLRFFGEPTPGGPNNEGYLGEVAPLRFGHERGLYAATVTRTGGVPGFDLTITTATPGARIVYTLDGKNPNDTAGNYRVPPGRDYTGPIHISKTTCVRAVALKPGFKPTKIHTQTYIFDSRDLVKSLPIISLVGDPGNTFYEPDGVMAIVGGTYTGGVWTPSGANSYNNMNNRDLERPVSAEWIVPGDDDEEFQVDCGLRVHGSPYMRPRYVRQNGQWSGDGKISLRLYFRGEYGATRLEYPLFPQAQVEQFETVVLRAGHNDRTNPFIKDELLRRLHRDMGQVACLGTFASLFINGEYKGYYNPTEHVKEESCQQWFGSDKPWDVMTMNGIRDGDSQSWDAMISYARNNNLADPTAYAELCKKLDVVNFIDYLIIRLWPNDWDWPQNNWSAACERSATGQWRFFVWDAEGTFESSQLQLDRFAELNTQGNGNGYLYQALKANKDFRLLFADRTYKHFFNGGALTQENVSRRFLEMRDELRSVIPNMNTYIVDTWTLSRHNIFLNACIREGMYTFAGPTLVVGGAPRHGGYADRGELLQIVPSRTGLPIYYSLDGSDPSQSDSTQAPVANTLVSADSPKRVLIPSRPDTSVWRLLPSFDDSRWTPSSGAPGGVGFERSTGYETYLSADVGNQMYNLSGTCYIRIPFQFTGDQAVLETMTLSMQYDDGFVAYLNGTEVARRNFEGEPAWNSVASAAHDDAAAVLFEAIDISTHIDKLQPGGNLLAIHGLNAGATSSDFLINAELVVSRAITDRRPADGPTYATPITLTKSTLVKARVQNGATWSALTEAVFAVGPVSESLRISEIMYHPEVGDSSSEYVELTNVGTEAINLNLVRFTKGIDFVFPDVELTPGAFCLVVKDRDAFEATYGPGLPVVGQYTGSLSDSGERIELQDAVGAVIHSFRYRDDWFDLADGEGFSLTVADPAGTPVLLWDARNTWRPSTLPGGSPGLADDGIPPVGTVVINEVLANSAGVGPDWIELHNTTAAPVDISGWFLSDDADDLTRYQIAEGTIVGPQGYLVFRESQHFGNPADPGCRKAFGLSRSGETVRLRSGFAGAPTGYCEEARFGLSDPGITLGRCDADAALVPLTEPTPGAANADPIVGPVVISEIMYHASGSTDVEYVELLNVSDAEVTLYDPDRGAPWRFTDGSQDPGIVLLFPHDPPVALGPYEYLLLVKDLALFESRFTVPASTQVLEWGTGRLSNAGETIQIDRPGGPDEEGLPGWMVVDRVHYSDGSHHEVLPDGLDLWPPEADGRGFSLTRVIPTQYGGDPSNWRATTPSPGAARPHIDR